jgi:hypothetical protein
MVVSCNFTVNVSETSEGMMRRPKIVPFLRKFLDRFQIKPKYNPYNPMHKIKDRTLIKKFKDLKYGAQALRMSLANIQDMRVSQAQRTEEDFKVAEKDAAELSAAAEAKAADEEDANLLGDMFPLEAPRRIEAPFLFFPEYIMKATEDFCNDKVPIKKFIEKHLYYVGKEDDRGVLLRPTDCILKSVMFKEFIIWAREDERGDDTLLKLNQSVFDAALAAEGVLLCKDGPEKNQRKEAYWN